jgi:uncharacterized protein YybS (DUF2232 family)
MSSSTNIKLVESQRKSDNQANDAFNMEKEDGAARKKLRLSGDQAASLEQSFKKHSTLNPVCLFVCVCVFSCLYFISF